MKTNGYVANGAIQSMFEPLHHVLTHQGKVPQVLPSNGFWLRAMTGRFIPIADVCPKRLTYAKHRCCRIGAVQSL